MLPAADVTGGLHTVSKPEHRFRERRMRFGFGMCRALSESLYFAAMMIAMSRAKDVTGTATAGMEMTMITEKGS